MINESRYILRRILIGVGIVLVLSFVNGCKVKALTLFSGVEVPDVDNIVGDNAFYITYYNSSQLRLLYQPSNVDNLYLRDGTPDNWIGSSRIYSLPITTNGNNITVNSNAQWTYKGTVSQDYGVWLYNDETALSCLNYYYTNTGSCPSNNLHPYHSYFNKNILYSNGDIFRNISLYSAYLPSQQPSFVSFNATKVSDDYLLTGYIFRPEFSFFDTNNYDYSFSFDNLTWQNLTENKEIIRVNQNTNFYVRIYDKNNNEVIDSATFNINTIGQIVSSNDYNIEITGNYNTDDDDSSATQLISSYDLNINYSPNSSNLIYQFQYVEEDDSLDNNNWETITFVNSSVYNYTTNSNGTMYARILDNQNNVLTSTTFTVSSIGQIVFKNSGNSIINGFNNISKQLNFARPISSIIKIPINLINVITTGLAGGLTCTDYSLGSLYGTNLVIPCVNIKQHLGNSLYYTIDLIIACCMLYHIFKMISELYANLLFMYKNPIQDLGKRGD